MNQNKKTLWTSAALMMALMVQDIIAQEPTAMPMKETMQMGEAKTALDGYCVVCAVEMKKREKGSPDFASMFDGMTYLFPNDQIKAKFDSMPERFVPTLNGDCIVCFAKMGKRVPGSIQHASLHRGRLYLFPSENEKKAFMAAPESFENADLAANGECIVCLSKMNHHVAGSPEFTTVYQGLRYQFPSGAEQSEFVREPSKYAVAGGMMEKESMSAKPDMKDNSSMPTSDEDMKLVRVTGRSGCAGCEHGVRPIASPNELGLAVNTIDGQVIVIEDAHTLYPKIYADRFDGQTLLVEGSIVKRDGRVSWMKPKSIRVQN